MPRKGENIYKRKDGRYEGRYIKSRSFDGQIKYGYIYGKKYSDVKQELTLLKAQFTFAQKKKLNASETVRSWMMYWLETSIKAQVKLSTYMNYRGHLDRYILPKLGEIQLVSLQTKDIEHFIEYLSSIDLSAQTIRCIFNILKSGMKKARLSSYIYENPCDNVSLPKNDRKKVAALDIKTQKELEKLALKRGCFAIILSLYTGMRIGEISGLKWSDVDLKNNVLYINRIIVRVPIPNEKLKTKIILGSPKTKSSVRAIPIAPNLKRYLETIRKEEAEFVIPCGNNFSEPRIINYHFKKIVDEMGRKDIHFHMLRHTFATRCVEKGVDIASLSMILGHSSTKMTLDTYTDSMWETRKQAVTVVDKQLQDNDTFNNFLKKVS
ncbi:tyrosine-type recombinase/integrase [Enterococcus sp. BWR-S5]|uniref:tyrosine-type recombinase/integrase n=1 Tax=Enterococcus sp. BWR-S5 TaxID=2787714 RepID=UPI00192071A0|nr:site-specific integrase [Enterococcus sp. BWR-S5]MBL1227327.1 site-specific integrase [Enterococcus sp. BWR-S5]